MSSGNWVRLCDDWHLQADVQKLFFLSGGGVPSGHRVVEVPFVDPVFVHELAADVAKRKRVPASAMQALEYTLAYPHAQFMHPLFVCGEGAAVRDQNKRPQILSLSCYAGIPAMFISRQGERLSGHARLLVLEQIPVR